MRWFALDIISIQHSTAISFYSPYFVSTPPSRFYNEVSLYRGKTLIAAFFFEFAIKSRTNNNNKELIFLDDLRSNKRAVSGLVLRDCILDIRRWNNSKNQISGNILWNRLNDKQVLPHERHLEVSVDPLSARLFYLKRVRLKLSRFFIRAHSTTFRKKIQTGSRKLFSESKNLVCG